MINKHTILSFLRCNYCYILDTKNYIIQKPFFRFTLLLMSYVYFIHLTEDLTCEQCTHLKLSNIVYKCVYFTLTLSKTGKCSE